MKKTNFFHRHWRNRIAVRLFLLILVLVLPLNIISILGAWNLNQERKEQFRLDKKNILDVYTNSLSLDMTRVEDYWYEMISENEDFLILKKQKGDADYQNSRYRCYESIRKELAKEPRMDGYFLVMKNLGDELSVFSPVMQEEKEAFLSFLKQSAGPEEKWQTLRVEGKEYLVRISQNSDLLYGTMIQSRRMKQELLEESDMPDAEVCLGKPVQSNDMVMISGKLPQANDNLYLLYEKQTIFQGSSLWSILVLIGALLLLLVIPVLYFFIKRLVVRPLGTLQDAHNQLEQGNRAYRIQEQAETYEYQIVFDSFNSMMHSIQKLQIENMEKELDKKRLELSNLQLQIRPHFLLNTFNLICTLCDGNQNDKIQEVMIYLSNYFRYLFSSGKDLELFQKEFTLIEGYIKAAQIRYPGRVNILYEIEPEISMVRMPPLLLHNFVENAVSHGMPKDREINILLEAWYENREVIFRLSDHGNGMEAAQVEQINQEHWENPHSHLGIQNSVKRLKYFYGDQAKITVESTPEEGSTFEIRFPYVLEEGEEYEN